MQQKYQQFRCPKLQKQLYYQQKELQKELKSDGSEQYITFTKINSGPRKKAYATDATTEQASNKWCGRIELK